MARFRDTSYLMYQSQAFKDIFQAFRKFSSIFMQAHAKRDLYDTFWMIKGTLRYVDGVRRILKVKNSVLEFDQDLASTSWDVARRR